jgi:alpha-amylase/alpha-mannosidase (GH57 family)
MDGQKRYVCIHGHFYQPPRENPWLEAVELQDSAAPAHDWNERITRECYGPNCRARLVDSQGRIIDLINNYAWMSFNFGPTLLPWMQQAAPEVLRGIVEGDRLSVQRRHGHGNALAQVYNHVIMPLAEARDKRSQVLWGIADFRERFGREPEGMWLAETAADVASLEALAEAGIKFTLMAPRQAKRWRRVGEQQWQEKEGIDPSRAYLCRLPSGKSIALFFYDGAISQAVAFEKLLVSGEKFLDRLMMGFDTSRQHPQLVHIATDGESYGHHHPHGDMALAYVLQHLRNHEDIKLTNYGEFLELHPPQWEVEIHDNSSWSCVHGVERWKSDRGCNTGRGWHQKWRGPLRDSLNQLKRNLDELFAAQGKERFPDPWQARDAYIEVILDRRTENVREFLKKSAHANLPESEFPACLWLLEMQRHGMLMFTSCGWFFDEISGLETTQCLRYAARAIQLAKHFQRNFEDEFVAGLEKAPSNLREFQTGRGVWERLVRPERLELERVLAHYAISMVYREPHERGSVYCYDIDVHDHEVQSRANTHLAMGRLRVRSRLTWNEAETSFLVVHYGGLDWLAMLRRVAQDEENEAFKRKLMQTYTTGSMADVTELATREFQGETYRLGDLLIEEQRRIVGILLQDRYADYRQTFEHLANLDEEVIFTLGRMRHPIPRMMRMAATVTFDHRVMQDISEHRNGTAMARIKNLLERGKVWGYQPEQDSFREALTRQVQTVLSSLHPDADLPALTEQASRVLDIASLLGLQLELWEAQNQLLEAFDAMEASRILTPELRQTFSRLAEKLSISPQLLGWRP